MKVNRINRDLNIIQLLIAASPYLEPWAVRVKTITDIVLPTNPKVAMTVKITPSIINLKNFPSSIEASSFGDMAENILFLLLY